MDGSSFCKDGLIAVFSGSGSGENGDLSDWVDIVSECVALERLVTIEQIALGGADSIVPKPMAIDPIEAIRAPAVPDSGSGGPSLTSSIQYEQL